MSLPLGWRWVPASALIVDVLALIVTYSRGGYVGLAVFTVVAAALSWPIRRRAWPVLGLLICRGGRRGGAAAERRGAGAEHQSGAGAGGHRHEPAVHLAHGARGVAGAPHLGHRDRHVQRRVLGVPRAGRARDVRDDRRPRVGAQRLPADPGDDGRGRGRPARRGGAVGAVARRAGATGAAGAWTGSGSPGGRPAPPASRAVSVVDENLFIVTNVSVLLLFSAAAAAQVSLAGSPVDAMVGALVGAAAHRRGASGCRRLLPAPAEATALHAQASQEVTEGSIVRRCGRLKRRSPPTRSTA